jgi:DNA-binding transcriptional ArsR family regulator
MLMDSRYKNFDHKLVDKLFSNRLRVAIMSALLHSDEIDFSSLKEAVKATDGNLSIQLKLLNEAGFLVTNKVSAGKREQTYMALSDKGRAAIGNYRNLMQSWL